MSVAKSEYRPKRGPVVEWSKAANVEALQRLQKAGATAREVAEHFGCSRNSAIGAMWRHGLKSKDGLTIMKRVAAARLTPEQVKAVLALATSDKSARAIAAELGLGNDQVLGVFKNNGVDRRALMQAKAVAAAAARATAQRIEAMAKAVLPDDWAQRFVEGHGGQHGRIEIAALAPSHCKFPIDQPEGGVKFCGLAVVDGKSYCADHHARCTTTRIAPKMAGKAGWFMKGPAR